MPAVRKPTSPGREFPALLRLRREVADALHIVVGAGGHQADALAHLQHALLHPHQHDDAEIGVVPAVDQQRLERRLGVAGGRRQAVDDGLQHLLDVEAGLGRDGDGAGGIEADHVLDLLLHPLHLGGGQVDLVQHRHDLMAGVDRLVDVGQGLRLHALGGIHHQQRALAGGEAAAHLIGEVHMARRIHQVELVGLAVAGLVGQAHGLGLDGDAPLPLDIHGIEDLVAHLPVGDGAAGLDQPVGQGGFAMVDMGDDREVADMGEIHDSWVFSAGYRRTVNSSHAGRPSDGRWSGLAGFLGAGGT